MIHAVKGRGIGTSPASGGRRHRNGLQPLARGEGKEQASRRAYGRAKGWGMKGSKHKIECWGGAGYAPRGRAKGKRARHETELFPFTYYLVEILL